MAIYNVLGNALVSNDEIIAKAATGDFMKFENDLKADKNPTINFTNGLMTKESINKPIPFERIGLGKPLGIEIRHVYTGAYPEEPGWFQDKKNDLLVTTAIKSGTVYKKAPRAVNHLKKNVGINQDIDSVSAKDLGQQLVYYKKAEVTDKIILDIELTFDKFNKQFYDNLANVFAEAAGIPIFATASSYLIAGSMITRFIGNLGEAIFDGEPFFNQTEEIRLFEPGMPVSRSGYAVVLPNNTETQILKDYELGPKEWLVKKGDNSEKYDGPIPYVVLALDGTARGQEYEKFTPTLASAELLERFFNIKENQTKSLANVIEMLETYDDLIWRNKADETKKKIEQSGITPEEKNKLDILYKAYVANISNNLLKPIP
ncbi:MAG: hypothetical protein FVQ82_01515 [Planctomycetes bacterium]|nr:hypothetical protein [Planctomycetota bacterium]